MRLIPGRIPSRYRYIGAAGALAACLFFGIATNLRLTKNNTHLATASSSGAAVPDLNAALGTPLLQVTAGNAGLKPLATSEQATRVHLIEGYGKLPLSFEANQGQTDPQVKFLSRGHGYSLFLTSDEAVLALHKPSAVSGQPSGSRNPIFETRQSQIANLKAPIPNREPVVPTVLRMQLVGANASAKVSGGDELPGKSNYFRGNDPQKWRTNVSNYAKVKYQEVYPGIDLVYYGNHGKLEYDFVVAPGADPRAIKFDIRGAEKVELSAQGDLVLQADGGEIALRKPVVFQPTTDNGQPTTAFFNPKSKIPNPKFVEGRYVLRAANPESPTPNPMHEVAFEIAAYDPTHPLIIDPVLSYATYLGGGDLDFGTDIAIDSSGNAYVTGYVESTDFPTVNPYQANLAIGAYGSQPDIFVSKLDPTGSALVYSTYLGGTDGDVGAAIAIDSSGNAYVTGETCSPDFPTVSPFQAIYGGGICMRTDGGTRPCNDAFIATLSSTGSELLHSTYLGGSNDDIGNGIALDASGNTYVTGGTLSANFPLTPGAFQTTHSNYSDVFVTKLASSGGALAYSTLLGGSQGYSGGNADQGGNAIAVDSSGAAYVTGSTDTPDFPTTPGAFRTSTGPGGSIFVTKLNPAGSALVYSTYLASGGGGGFGIALDPSGSAYVTGATSSATDFPTTPGVFQTVFRGSGLCTYGSDTIPCPDAFVTKLNPAGSALVYSTYLGGTGADGGTGVAVDGSGNAYISGITVSTDFPTVAAVQPSLGGNSDAFVTKVNPAGSALVFSTYLGGSGADGGALVPYPGEGVAPMGPAIALDSSGNAYVAGFTESIDFPTANPLQAANAGSSDAFVVKIAPQPLVNVVPTSLAFGSQVVGVESASQPVTLSNVGDGVLTISSIAFGGTNPNDFAQSGCGTSVAAGASCTINVTFTPTAVGARAGTLTITHNAPSSADSVSLSGTGTDFTLSADPTSRTVTAGQSASYTLSVTPAGGFNQSVALSCAWVGTQPRGTSCTVSPTSVALDGTTPQNATVTVTTTARSLVAPLTRLPVSGLGSRMMVPWLLWLMAFASLAMLAAARRDGWAWLRKATPLGALLFVVLLWSACGGGGGGAPPPEQKGTPAGTYSLTITGTSGGASRSTTLTLHVN